MPTIYKVKKPKYSNWQWFKFIAVRVVFPPILLWDLIKMVVNKLIGQKIGKIVLDPQESFQEYAISDAALKQHNKSKELFYKKYTVETHDGACLDSLEIKPKSQENAAPNDQKYIIGFVGREMCYEKTLDKMNEYVKKFKYTVIGFNYRTVLRSTGELQSPNDLVIDGIAQVQRLLDQGVPAENIILDGHSLGGAIASLVAQYFHQKGLLIYLFNNRSFSNATNFLVGICIELCNEDPNLYLVQQDAPVKPKSSIGEKLIRWLLKPLIKFVVTLVKWEMEAGDAFKSIPEAYTDYIVVKSKNEVDDTIPPFASIHRAVYAQRREKKNKIDKEIANIKHKIKASPQDKLKLEGEIQILQDARDVVKKYKKMHTVPRCNGHNVNFQNLQNYAGKNAFHLFQEFLDRTKKPNIVNAKAMDQHQKSFGLK